MEGKEGEKRLKAEPIKGLAKAYYDLVKFRVALGNTLRHTHSWHPYLQELFRETEEREKRIVELSQKALESHPVYQTFLRKVKGVGPAMAAYLLDYFDIEKAEHVSSFWRFAGLAPGSRKQRGRRVDYNPALKSIILGRLFKQLMLARGYYAKLYYQFRAELAKQHPEWTDGKRHARARLKTAKVFLQHLWVVWRRLEGLNVTKPYPVDRLGHAYLDVEPLLDQESI